MTRKRSRLVSINPRLRNLCINKLILGRVVPTISDNSSCDIFSSMRVLCWSLSAKPKRQKKELRQSGWLGKITVYLKSLGPGPITGASDDDPSGIGTYSHPLKGGNDCWPTKTIYQSSDNIVGPSSAIDPIKVNFRAVSVLGNVETKLQKKLMSSQTLPSTFCGDLKHL